MCPGVVSFTIRQTSAIAFSTISHTCGSTCVPGAHTTSNVEPPLAGTATVARDDEHLARHRATRPPGQGLLSIDPLLETSRHVDLRHTTDIMEAGQRCTVTAPPLPAARARPQI